MLLILLRLVTSSQVKEKWAVGHNAIVTRSYQILYRLPLTSNQEGSYLIKDQKGQQLLQQTTKRVTVRRQKNWQGGPGVRGLHWQTFGPQNGDTIRPETHEEVV